MDDQSDVCPFPLSGVGVPLRRNYTVLSLLRAVREVDGPAGRRLHGQRRAILDAAGRRRVSSVRVLGSVARGDDTENSDIDRLVDLADDVSLLELIGLGRELSERLGRRVDGQACRRHADPVADLGRTSKHARDVDSLARLPGRTDREQADLTRKERSLLERMVEPPDLGALAQRSIVLLTGSPPRVSLRHH
jgi:predicted nucleotidyltransferase